MLWIIALITTSYRGRAELVRRDRSAQRLKQGRRIGKAIGAGLKFADQGLLIALFGVDESEITHRADLKLASRHFQALLGRTFGPCGSAFTPAGRVRT